MTGQQGEIVPVVRPQRAPGCSGLRWGVSTRNGGVSPHPLGLNLSFNVGDDEANVVENRRRFFGAMGIEAERVAFPRQCHSAVVRQARVPGPYPSCDALITDLPDLYLAVTVADCVPVLVADPVRGAVAAIHAGWRGTAGEIVLAALDEMRRSFGSRASDLTAYIGPSAGACCYEVGADVAERFLPFRTQRGEGTFLIDLKEANRRQLESAGVAKERIEVSVVCSICHASTCHSYRRDGDRSGRMMGVIGIASKER